MGEQSNVEVSIARIDQWMEDKGDKIDQIHEVVYGNGKDGLIVKVDRNTRWRKTITWAIPVLIAAAAVVVAIIK